MKKTHMKEIKILISALALGLFAATLIATYTQAYAINVQNEIADNVIRFHVMANSDTFQDQALKNEVRDAVLERFGENLDPSFSIAESRTFLQQNLQEIEEYASLLVRERGYDYPVQAAIGRVFFPSRNYGDMSFPAGEYEALRIIIGNGSGGNWWCVMFPPLCYVPAATAATDDHTLLRNLLSTETYALLNHYQENSTVTIRFRVVEWWQERMYDSDSDSSPNSSPGTQLETVRR